VKAHTVWRTKGQELQPFAGDQPSRPRHVCGCDCSAAGLLRCLRYDLCEIFGSLIESRECGPKHESDENDDNQPVYAPHLGSAYKTNSIRDIADGNRSAFLSNKNSQGVRESCKLGALTDPSVLRTVSNVSDQTRLQLSPTQSRDSPQISAMVQASFELFTTCVYPAALVLERVEQGEASCGPSHLCAFRNGQSVFGMHIPVNDRDFGECGIVILSEFRALV